MWWKTQEANQENWSHDTETAVKQFVFKLYETLMYWLQFVQFFEFYSC